MKLMRVGVDLAKNVFQVHGVDCSEKPVWGRRLTRKNWLKVLVEQVESDCEIGMESCSGAQHWDRQLQARGFQVKLVAQQFVKPYVKSNKNDANDAEAVCEAVGDGGQYANGRQMSAALGLTLRVEPPVTRRHPHRSERD